MKVWWCEEHLCGTLPNRDTEGWASVPGQSGVCFFAEEFGSETNCRMVEMQLVPADARMVSGDALVVEKVEGEWPKWAVNAIGLVDNIHASYVLDNFALASAQVGGK